MNADVRLVWVGMVSWCLFGALWGADVTVPAGATLHSTDAALDAWRSTGENGVRYTPQIALDGGTFIFDDAAAGEFAGTISGVGAVEIRNSANFLFRGGEGLASGTTVHVEMPPSTATLTIGGGNVFGGADEVYFRNTLVRYVPGETVEFPASLTVRTCGPAFYTQENSIWTFHGPLSVEGGTSFAEYGTFRFTGTIRGTASINGRDSSTIDLAGAKIEPGLPPVIMQQSSTVKVGGVDAETSSNLKVSFVSAENAQLDLGGHDVTLHSISDGNANAHIVNSGEGTATLTTCVGATYNGTMEKGVVLDAAGGSVFDGTRLSNDGLVAREGVVKVTGFDDVHGLRARYVRFMVDKFRTTGETPATVAAWSIVALSEFVLLAGDQHLVWPAGTTATQLVPTSPTTCGADLLIDGDTRTKHCVEMQGDGFIVVFDMQRPVSFSGYRWYTADDAPQRDPIDWTVDVSDDGETWRTVDVVVGNATTTDRRQIGATRQLAGDMPMDALSAAGYRLATGENGCLELGDFFVPLADVSQASNLVLNDTAFAWNESFAANRGRWTGKGAITLDDGAGTVQVPFGCDLPGIAFRTVAGRPRTVAFDDPAACIRAMGGRSVRFTVRKIASGAVNLAGQIVAFSEFELLRNGEKVEWPTGTTATQLKTTSPTTCGADLAIDGSLDTKHCVQMMEDGFVVQIDMGEWVPFDGYRWYTADDSPPRDPVDWTVEVSNDGVQWAVVDIVVGNPAIEDRKAVAASLPVGDGFDVDGIGEGLTLDVAESFTVNAVRETVDGLVGAGAVQLVNGGELVVDVPANAEPPLFSGTISCDGAFVKTGAGTQRLSGRVACDRLVVQEGVLDVRGAQFKPGIEVLVEEGAHLKGRSGLTVVIR